MLFCNDTITLYNRYYDYDNDTTKYMRTVIQGVAWWNTLKVSVDKEGLNSADTFTVRVMADADFGGKEYVKPKVFQEAEDKTEMFTLANGDIVVHGIADETDPKAKDLMSKYEAMTVISVTDNRRMNPLKHWKVVGQ